MAQQDGRKLRVVQAVGAVLHFGQMLPLFIHPEEPHRFRLVGLAVAQQNGGEFGAALRFWADTALYPSTPKNHTVSDS